MVPGSTVVTLKKSALACFYPRFGDPTLLNLVYTNDVNLTVPLGKVPRYDLMIDDQVVDDDPREQRAM